MQEASEKPSTSAQNNGSKFIDTLIAQWVNRTDSNIALQQAEEPVTESSTAVEGQQQLLQNQERIIQALQRKLKQSQKTETTLSATLEVEIRNKDEIQTKLNATWESIETITEYFNYISETLASFQQHRANLSILYDNVILKQQQDIQKLQLNNTKSKDLEQLVVQLQNKSQFQEERLQEATAEQTKLRKQLEDFAHEMQSQKNELANTYAEEKLKFVKEQQRLLFEHENLQSRIQTIEKEKSDIAKSKVQLENKLLFQEEKLQEALTERNKFQQQLENAENTFYLQKDNLLSTHTEETKTLFEEQERLKKECESLKSRLNIVERDKNDLMETIKQKDAILSQLKNENSMHENKTKMMTVNINDMHTKYESLTKQQNVLEKELRVKTDKIHNLEVTLNTTKQREAGLVNDINRIEKNLISEMDYSKNLKNKLSEAQRDLQFVQMQTTEIEKTLERNKTTIEFMRNEHEQQLKTLQREKEEVAKRENKRVKNIEILYENFQTKHAEEISTLRNGYETHLLKLKETVDSLNEKVNGIEKEKNELDVSLINMRVENNTLKNNHQFTVERNNELEEKLKEITKMLQIKSNLVSTTNQQVLSGNKIEKDQQQSGTKRKHEIPLDPEITEIAKANQGNVSTSIDFSDDEEEDLYTYSQERQSQKEQEAEVTSAGRKFFKSRSSQPRTYGKRRQK